jgi:ABC-type enterochelin transport system substrate-binding protein
MLDSDKDAKLLRQVKQIQELIEKLGPEDGRSVFVYENIGLSSAIENLKRISTKGKRVKYIYIQLSDVGEKSP